MPANNQRTKHYRIQVDALESFRAVPATPDRTFLMIQNTGANPALIHFQEDVQGDGSDILLSSFEILPPFQIAETCPTGAINVFSEDGTTLAIVEGIIPGFSQRDPLGEILRKGLDAILAALRSGR